MILEIWIKFRCKITTNLSLSFQKDLCLDRLLILKVLSHNDTVGGLEVRKNVQNYAHEANQHDENEQYTNMMWVSN